MISPRTAIATALAVAGLAALPSAASADLIGIGPNPDCQYVAPGILSVKAGVANLNVYQCNTPVGPGLCALLPGTHDLDLSPLATIHEVCTP